MPGFQSGFTTYLGARLAPSDVAATLAVPPTITNGRLLLVNGNVHEWTSYSAVSGNTVTGMVRSLSQTADPVTGGTGLDWPAGTTVILVAMHDQIVDKEFPFPFPIYTTAQRNALVMTDDYYTGTAPILYNSTTGQFEYWNGSAWTAFATGTVADASTTVAGKVEISTSAQSRAGTDTGETGAKLTVLPSDIAKNAQSGTFTYGTDVGGDDTYVVALTPILTSYTVGQRLSFKPTTGNTGACTIDFGPGVLNIKTKDGTDPQTGVIRAGVPISGVYDGTNFIIDGEVFASTTDRGVTRFATDADINDRTTDEAVTPDQLDKFSVSTNLRSDWYTIQAGETAWTTTTYTSTNWNAGGFWTFTGNATGVSSTSLPGNGSTANYGPALNKDIRLKWRWKVDATGGGEVQGFGFCITPANIFTAQTNISNGLIRFIQNGTTLYAHNSNGTTATSTDVTSGITTTNYNTYEIIFNPGTDIKFYINGTLVATHTTNLPTTGTLVLAHGVSSARTVNMFPPILSFEL